jgi:hypothetical protein
VELTYVDGSYAIRLGAARLARVSIPTLAGHQATVTTDDVGAGWQRVRFTWQLDRAVKQDELAIEFALDMQPDLWWAPHLAPTPGDVIAQHVFRSPALVVCQEGHTLVLVPDLDICGRRTDAPWLMDVDTPARKLWLGMTQTEIVSHVEYRKKPGMTLAPGTVELGFYVSAYTDEQQPRNPWSQVSHFLWERYGRPLLAEGQPLTVPLDEYVGHVYRWAFDTWETAVWQEFELGGQRVGAPARRHLSSTLHRRPIIPAKPTCASSCPFGIRRGSPACAGRRACHATHGARTMQTCCGGLT